MIRCCSGERGFAMVYGLVVLLLATIGGTSLLFITQKDRTTVTDYIKMRSASLAATAALRACEGQFQNDPSGAFAILNKFKTDNSYKWMLGASTNANNEQKLKFWNSSDAPQFSVCILAYNEDSSLITVRGSGYGGYGGVKHVIASYKLQGLSRATISNTGKFAIYLAKDGQNFNQAITINGNVYFGGTFRTQSGLGSVTINGDVKTGVSTVLSEVLNSWTINGNALFQCPVKFSNGLSTINGKAGFAKELNCGSALTVGGNAYFNSTLNTDGSAQKVNMQNHVATHSGSLNTAYLQNASSVVNNGGAVDLAAKVGICSGGESPLTINVSSIPAAKIKSYNTVIGSNTDLTGTRLNTYYNNNPSQLWNNYLVVKISPTDNPSFSSVNGVFTGKVIWIIENAWLSVNQNWYESSPTAITLIYVGNGHLNPIGWPGLFRGYIYVTGTGTAVYSFKAGASMKGGINHASASTDFETVNTNMITLTYDDAIIQEFVDLGIATRPTPTSCGSGGSGTGIGEITIMDIKIRPLLLGVQL